MIKRILSVLSALASLRRLDGGRWANGRSARRGRRRRVRSDGGSFPDAQGPQTRFACARFGGSDAPRDALRRKWSVVLSPQRAIVDFDGDHRLGEHPLQPI